VLGFSNDQEAKMTYEEVLFKKMAGNRRGDFNSVGDGTREFTPSVGRFKDGMLRLSRSDFERVGVSLPSSNTDQQEKAQRTPAKSFEVPKKR
jgi:hypothetical protein